VSRFNIAIISIILCAAVTALAGYAFQKIRNDPHAFAEAYATHLTGRTVTIGALHFRPGDLFHIELDDVHVANKPWGAVPDIATIGHFSGDVKPWSILFGPMKFRNAVIDDATIVLEHNSNGAGNWRQSDTPHPTKPGRGLRARKKFPSILDFTLTNSRVIFHTSEGATLKIAFNDFTLHTDAEDQPVTLRVDGSYNDIPVHMDIATQSFNAFHDAGKTFHAHVFADGATTSVIMDVDMTDPLNFEGVQGQLDVAVKKLGVMAGLFGGPFDWNVPVHFSSTITRDNDIWDLTQAHGDIAANNFDNSRLHLAEGARLKPDDIKAELNFESISIDSLMSKNKTQHANTERKLSSLEIGDNPSSLIDATLRANTLSYGAVRASSVKTHISIAPNAIVLDDAAMDIFGGRAQADIHTNTTRSGLNVAAQVDLADANVPQILKALHNDSGALQGRVTTGLSVIANGDTVEKLERNLRGAVAVTMTNGQIAQQDMRLASSDLRALFHRDPNFTPVSCMLGIVRFTDGIGTLSPFQMKTGSGTLIGSGVVNLSANMLNLTLRTERKSTSAFALDIPIGISGSLDSPKAGPRLGGVAPAKPVGGDVSLLPPYLQIMIDKNPCAADSAKISR
jgi:uncharacterized protein involved in outer membrane biogenesis